MKKIILLHLLWSLTFSCKNILSSPEEQKKILIPSDEKLITLLYEKISKDDFDLEILSKKLLSQNKITVERKYFAENKVKNSNFQEVCQEIELKLNQITKKKCFMSKGKKLILKCSPRQIKCRKWTRPLFFAEYCEKGQEIHFLKKGKILDPLLKIQTCSPNENGPLKLRNFKLI
jgi:hypothetical protein